MTGSRVLLLRRNGGLWGVVHDAVRTVTRGDDSYRIWLRDGELDADDVLGVIDDLRVWPASGVLSRYWGQRAHGLAVYGSTPLVVLDPDSPPAVFGSDAATETSDGDDDQPSH